MEKMYFDLCYFPSFRGTVILDTPIVYSSLVQTDQRIDHVYLKKTTIWAVLVTVVSMDSHRKDRDGGEGVSVRMRTEAGHVHDRDSVVVHGGGVVEGEEGEDCDGGDGDRERGEEGKMAVVVLFLCSSQRS